MSDGIIDLRQLTTTQANMNEFIHKIKTLQAKYMDKPEKKKVSYASRYGEILSNYGTLTKEHHYFRYYDDILMLHVTVVKEKTDGLRIPKRFVVETESGHEVITQKDGVIASSTVEIILEGNDGFVSIIGLSEGDVLIAP